MPIRRTREPGEAAHCRRSSAPRMEGLETRRLFAGVVDVTIDPGTKYQTLDGFGTSLGGSPSLKQLQSNKLQKLYWGDLGASMLRVNLAFQALKAKDGNLATPVYMGPDIDRNIKRFNWGEHNIKNAGTLARASLKHGAGDAKIIASIWSPPHWMKGEEVSSATGNPVGVQPKLLYNAYGAANGSGGSLINTDENLTQFGRYVAAYVKGFERAYGVPIYALSIQNELAFHQSYSSAVYSPDLYVSAIKAVSRWFRREGIKTKLIGPEDVGVGSEKDPYILARQMRYIKALRADPEANAAVWGYAIHGYANDGVTENRSPEMWNQYWTGRAGKPAWTGIGGDGKPSWMTEISGGTQSWSSALRLASNVQDSLVYGNASAWVYWGITPASATQSGYTLTTGVDGTANKYVAVKHFSQMIRPGAVRMKTTAVDPSGVYASAWVHDADKTVTAVLINNSDEPQQLRLRLPGITMDAFTRSYGSTERANWKRLKQIDINADGLARITLPANGLFTLQGSTATVARPAIPPAIVGGVYFRDHDGDGRRDASDKGLGGDKVFLDLNGNAKRDPKEPFQVTKDDGMFAFTVAPGTYQILRETPPGMKLTTPPVNVTAKPAQARHDVLIGIDDVAKPTVPKTGTINGRVFNDTDGDGTFDQADDSWAISKTVFLDSDNDGVLDPAEKRVTTDTAGNFSFNGLSAGTYHVRRVFTSGSTYSTKPIDISLSSGATKAGLVIGSRTVR